MNLAARLREAASSDDAPLRCGWCTLGSAFAAEVVGRSGADVVCVDVEHGLLDWHGALPIVMTLSAAAIPVLVRVPSHEPVAIMKALDAGADGVVVPHVESAEQAAATASACHYPPRGRRSWGPTRASLLSRGDAAAAGEGITCIAMVETAAAIDRVDEIAAAPGVDGVLVGSNDLALDLLTEGTSVGAVKESDAFAELLARAATACRRAGVVAGAPVQPSFSVDRLHELGFQLVVGTSDAALLRQAAELEFAAT